MTYSKEEFIKKMGSRIRDCGDAIRGENNPMKRSEIVAKFRGKRLRRNLGKKPILPEKEYWSKRREEFDEKQKMRNEEQKPKQIRIFCEKVLEKILESSLKEIKAKKAEMKVKILEEIGWKKGRIMNKHGYILIYMPDHPRAGRRGYVFEHIYVWMKNYGSIPKGWIVHHKNGIKFDNRIENLKIIPVREHHRNPRAKSKNPWSDEKRDWMREEKEMRPVSTINILT